MKHKNKWERLVDAIVDSLGYAIVRFAPVIAPIPSIAVILEVSGYTYFAWFTVVAIEMVGYAIGDKMVESVRRGVLGMNKAIIPIVIYAVVIEGLMLGYKVIPAWTGEYIVAEAVRSSVSMLYPFFTLAGAGLYAFHEYLKEVESDTNYDKELARQDKNADSLNDRELKHQRQQAELEAYKLKLVQDAEIEREKAMLDLRIKEQKSIVKVITGDSENHVDNQEVISVINYDKLVIDYYRDNPLSSQRKAASKTGISQSQISKTLSNLESTGIIHRNGNGVEILNRGEG